ncbi:MAG TPA: CDGSH iron-sulfur domain-containing protein [Conexivisphaerales archaeon]|nr:CDGSH iron-sulfur domain-containing protein [Conexivisphaerales archaeon]
MPTSSEKRIVVSKGGPFIVYGKVPLSVWVSVPDEDGFPWDWKEGKSFEVEEEYQLCRCGGSNDKPFCDLTHERMRFKGKEAASRLPFSDFASNFVGPTLILSDAEELCSLARFCDAKGGIWRLNTKSGDPLARELVIREANNCPAGRLVVRDRKTDMEIEKKLPPSIGVLEDTDLGLSGPLWVRGGIRIESHDGKPYEVRNRVTLCRCGASTNKPLCDRTHIDIEFKDGIIEFDSAK